VVIKYPIWYSYTIKAEIEEAKDFPVSEKEKYKKYLNLLKSRLDSAKKEIKYLQEIRKKRMLGISKI